MTNSGNTNIPAGASPARRRTTNVTTTAADSTVNNTKTPQKDEKPTKWVQIRLIPIWLRIIIIIALIFIAAIVGLTVGYSVLGDGNSSDVLEWSTWQHLLDIVNGKE